MDKNDIIAFYLMAIIIGAFIIITYDLSTKPFINRGYEKLEFLDVIGNTVVLGIKNTGMRIANLNTSSVYFNGRAITDFPIGDRPGCYFGNQTLYPGYTTTLAIIFPKTQIWSSGSNVAVTVQTEWQNVPNKNYSYSTVLALP